MLFLFGFGKFSVLLLHFPGVQSLQLLAGSKTSGTTLAATNAAAQW